MRNGSSSLSASSFRLIIEEITRLLNLEKQLPSYKYSVTVSCLKVIRKLQKCGHIPPSSKIYRSYAAYGQYIDVRVAALECLVDFVKNDGRWDDLEPLLDLLEADPDPMLKHKLLRLLIDNPPFERAHQHRLDRPHLVERLWMNMNQLTAYDSKLRCDLVDFYYMLYGIKKPSCLSSKEIADMLRPHKSHSHHGSGFAQIPRVPKTEVKRENDGAEEEEDPNRELNSFLTDKPMVVDMGTKRKLIEYEGDDGDMFGSGGGGGTGAAAGPSSVSLKTETLDEVVIGEALGTTKSMVSTMSINATTKISSTPTGGMVLQHQEVKRLQTESYYSDNSTSLPGMVPGSHPVGFEPGMFQSQDEQSMKIKSEKVSGTLWIVIEEKENSIFPFPCRRRKRRRRRNTRSISTRRTRTAR